MATSTSQGVSQDEEKTSGLLSVVAVGVIEIVVGAIIWTWAGLWTVVAIWSFETGRIVATAGVVALMILPAVVVQYHRLSGQVLPDRLRRLLGRGLEFITGSQNREEPDGDPGAV